MEDSSSTESSPSKLWAVALDKKRKYQRKIAEIARSHHMNQVLSIKAITALLRDAF